jgi:penicillin-binding protein 1A
VVRAQQGQARWLAPHFIWYVREELRQRLCGEAETCDALERGGMRVTTTLDWKIQQSGEKWISAAALVPHRANPAASAKALGVPYSAWLQRLRGQNVWNGALSAIDYERGEIIAYVGSAGYYERRKVSRKMQPQFDVLSQGWRQPGSAFKPFVYATGIDEQSLTASTMLMDVTTNFGGGYTPTDFSSLERGPVRVRNALQFSLNIPAVKALAITGENDVFERAKDFGMQFQRRRPTAGLSMALGTLEVHPLDLNRAYGTLANGGRDAGLTSILEVTADGEEVIPPHEPDRGEAAVSEQAAGILTDILAGNTDPAVNPIWAAHAITDRRGRRRPAAFKTGTTNDAKDLNAYGYIAPPSAQGRRQGQYALSVGVWAGNSDSSMVTTVANPVFSLDVAAPIWDAFLSEVTRTWEIRDFKRPGGLSSERVDAFTGYRASEFSRRQVNELFIRGTTPGDDPYLAGMEVVRGADDAWYRWEDSCDGRARTRGYLDLSDAEADFPSWNEAVRGWIRRARRGTGQGANVSRSKRTFTAYFYQPSFQPYGQTWGGPFPPTRSCDAAPSASPSPEASPSTSPSLEPSIPPEATPEPEATEPPEATPEPTPEPKPTKKPKPTEEPTPEPTEPPAPTEEPTDPPEAAPAVAEAPQEAPSPSAFGS